ncbi:MULTISPECIES: dihydrolipoyl dehydrogenase [unclassified Alistipes]|uniref:dihydrolipoyl dehydrogenase n=1 Tax=unclassified Alistipes TaxID=2608932 RepID=UPI0007A8D75E|nr:MULTISPECIES: dihydrolipoyl dehydrogenase [unclassified Alistipes]CVI65959.1 Dihydrolipoyl dehydrogenase [Alistipes sp. CHKCI003]
MKYDIIVIGSGPGGYVAAIRASQLGKKTAIVERAEAGGVCLNWGCIPTKALLKSAQVYTYCKNAAHYGLELAGEVRPDLEKIVARSRGVAETMSKGVAFLLKKNNIDLIQGFGRLKGDGRVNVDGTEYEADHIILATGARPREMPFMPIDGKHVISSREALTLTELPETMIVVGTGAIGSEFASLYASLGTKVTVIEYLPRMLPLEDEEVSKTMERSFRKLRATVLTSTTVKSVKVNADGKCEVEIEGKKGTEILTADVVLSAVGIKSNIERIGLEELGIRVERDKIVVDRFYRTDAQGVYAIGDIVGGPALAHVASAEAICCVEAICGLNPSPVDYSTVPSCVFTTPEVASVGLTEQQAREQGLAYKVGRFPFTASGKATAAGDRDGFVKLIFGEDDKLLGAHLVGANVTEMIAEPTLAKALGATAHRIARTIHAHPTMNEGVMEASEAAMGAAIHL